MHTDICQENDFSNLFEDYTNGLISPKVKTLAELIDFNEKNREIELPECKTIYPCLPHLLFMTEANYR